MTMKPARLKRGDTVGIIAPASPPNAKQLKKSLDFLKELGLNVKIGTSVYKEYGYLAGTDEERLEDIHCMFKDPEVHAIVCACGGFGTGRIVSKLNYDLIKQHPKIFWGYSDITFLHTAIHQQTGLVTFHGPMLSSDIGLDDVHELTKQSFQQLFNQQPIEYTNHLSPLETVVEGEASGPVIGGNLTLLVNTLGTPFEVDTKGKVFFIEDIDEEPYKVDRMVNQLKMAGKFQDAEGIIIGDFHNCDPVKREQSLTLDEIFTYHIAQANKPTMKGFKIGHCSPTIAIPIGSIGRMNTYDQTFIVESGIEEKDEAE
ncbi:S66 peptidase family protein [Metabacillus iocasae]|uniref:Muramoyltetrapeptide carboxypeptidase n=1 Tax=Priestia iocasae TaxID=2291674 RepID=A0ABS2QXM8_9BACI|nr:LD-carboxypeptidase [Metabacillus iocasae]MBM7703234.1 muramoyltetrapeptide carboxypeptidase [Metabacillus iocasae]